MNERTFTIDLSVCTGCLTCLVACSDRAWAPGSPRWLRVARTESGAFPDVALTYRVVHCFHCAQPACAAVCPERAITRSAKGTVDIDASMCSGCGLCAEACPFGAVGPDSDGIASKCDGCADETAAGMEPACVRACPMRALDYSVSPPIPGDRCADPDFQDHGLSPSVLYLRRPRSD